MKYICFLFAYLVPLSAWCAEPGVTYFDRSARALPKICLLPAEVEVRKVTFKGTVPLPKESEQWAMRIDQSLTQIFTEQGASPIGISPAEVAGHEDLRQSLEQLFQKYKTIEPKLTDRPEDVAKGRYTLGDEISLLPCSDQASAVVFVRGAIYEIRNLNPYGPSPESKLWLSFVDARSGSIIGLMSVRLKGGGFGGLGSHFTDGLGKAMGSGLAKLRVGNNIAYIESH